MEAKRDFRNTEKKDARESRFPAETAGEYRVHIAEDAYARMKKHADLTTEVELCGVLIGEVCRDAQGYFLKISAIIEGEKANNYGAQVTFTHETWQHIHELKDRQYPNQRIVGWYHTHPGFGVFLSSMDTFIQENFFNLPYQVALVLETKQKEEGCFAWVDGKSTPLSRYWVGSREVKLVAGEAHPFAAQAPAAEAKAAETACASLPREAGWGVTGLNILMMLVAMFCCFLLGKMTAVQALRETAVQGLESELYSMVDFTALTTAAGNDYEDARGKLLSAQQQLQKGDTAGANRAVQDLAAQFEQMKLIYDKKRQTFRNNLDALMQKRQTLSDRVDSTSRHQDEMAAVVANLYCMRAMDVLGTKDGKAADVSSLTASQRAALKMYIETAIRISPDAKQRLQEAFPQLLDTLFEAPKDNGAKAPAGTGTHAN